jgi:uncharacterized alpha/beta hydrolase family protein
MSTDKEKDTIVTISNKEPMFMMQEPTEEYYKFIITAENEKGDSSQVEIEKGDIVDEAPGNSFVKSTASHNLYHNMMKNMLYRPYLMG